MNNPQIRRRSDAERIRDRIKHLVESSTYIVRQGNLNPDDKIHFSARLEALNDVLKYIEEERMA